MAKTKKFPKTFESWSETYYLIVKLIIEALEKEEGYVYAVKDCMGYWGVWPIAVDWALEFEEIHKEKKCADDCGDDYYRDTLDLYFKKKNAESYERPNKPEIKNVSANSGKEERMDLKGLIQSIEGLQSSNKDYESRITQNSLRIANYHNILVSLVGEKNNIFIGHKAIIKNLKWEIKAIGVHKGEILLTLENRGVENKMTIPQLKDRIQFPVNGVKHLDTYTTYPEEMFPRAHKNSERLGTTKLYLVTKSNGPNTPVEHEVYFALESKDAQTNKFIIHVTRRLSKVAQAGKSVDPYMYSCTNWEEVENFLACHKREN